jgi:hypothetical protein
MTSCLHFSDDPDWHTCTHAYAHTHIYIFIARGTSKLILLISYQTLLNMIVIRRQINILLVFGGVKCRDITFSLL